MDGGEPDIPIYKVIECTGPTNTRVYKVAVYFRGKRLASSTGHSIQQAEMEAAKKALENSSELFPQLDYQKRVMAHSMKKQKGKPYDGDGKQNRPSDAYKISRRNADDDSHLPKQYRVRKQSKACSDDSDRSHSDAERSDSAPSMVSANGNKRCCKIAPSTFKYNSSSSEDEGSPHTYKSEIEKQEAKVELDDIESEAQNETEISAEIPNLVDSSDTDISLESGEIL